MEKEKNVWTKEQEIAKAKLLKGTRLKKNELFLIDQCWNDENYILHLYSDEHGIGYKHITEGRQS